MAEQIAVSAVDHAARIGDQPKRVPPLSRSFPGCTDKCGLAREDEAEGEVTRTCTVRQGVKDAEQLDEPGSPIGRRRCIVAGVEAGPVRHPLKAGSSGQPECRTGIAQNDQTVRAARRRETEAQAKPCHARCDDHVMFASADPLSERLITVRQWNCGDVAGFEYYHIRRGER